MTYAANFLSGKSGTLSVATIGDSPVTTALAFKKWSIHMTGGAGKTPNALANGYMTRVPGMKDQTTDVDMFTDQGNMGGITIGENYTVTLGYTSEVSLVTTSLLDDIVATDDVENPQDMKFKFLNNGSFTAAVP